MKRRESIPQSLDAVIVRIVLVVAVLCSTTQVALAATGMISGTIVDQQSGNPVIGASVIVEGTTISAACDIDGHFLIRDVPEGVYRIVLSSLGYTKRVVTDVKVMAG